MRYLLTVIFLLVGGWAGGPSTAWGEQIRMVDNTRVNVLIEAVTAEGALEVTTMDGKAQTIPLEQIVTIDFRGRSRRLLLSGTQELRYIDGSRLRGSMKGFDADSLRLETYSIGTIPSQLANLKGMVSLPRVGRVGRCVPTPRRRTD